MNSSEPIHPTLKLSREDLAPDNKPTSSNPTIVPIRMRDLSIDEIFDRETRIYNDPTLKIASIPNGKFKPRNVRNSPDGTALSHLVSEFDLSDHQPTMG